MKRENNWHQADHFSVSAMEGKISTVFTKGTMRHPHLAPIWPKARSLNIDDEYFQQAEGFAKTD